MCSIGIVGGRLTQIRMHLHSALMLFLGLGHEETEILLSKKVQSL